MPYVPVDPSTWRGSTAAPITTNELFQELAETRGKIAATDDSAKKRNLLITVINNTLIFCEQSDITKWTKNKVLKEALSIAQSTGLITDNGPVSASFNHANILGFESNEDALIKVLEFLESQHSVPSMPAQTTAPQANSTTETVAPFDPATSHWYGHATAAPKQVKEKGLFPRPDMRHGASMGVRLKHRSQKSFPWHATALAATLLLAGTAIALADDFNETTNAPDKTHPSLSHAHDRPRSPGF